MKTMIVDDEAIMLRKFLRISEGIRDIDVIGRFEDAESAIQFMKKIQRSWFFWTLKCQ